MNEQNRNGITELMIAASRGEQARVESLVAAGAVVDTTDAFGYSALMYAASAGHLAVVESLLVNGAEVRIKNKNGLGASDLAKAKGHDAIAKTLRHACLFTAARDGDVALLKESLDGGADVNVRFADGWTALMVSARNGHLEAVAALLHRGAERLWENHMGWTALLMAERKGHKEIVTLLRQGVSESSLPHLGASEHDYIASDITSSLEPLNLDPTPDLDSDLDPDAPTH